MGDAVSVVDLPMCEKLVGVARRDQQTLYLTRHMRADEVPEDYKLWARTELDRVVVAEELSEHCP